MIDDQGRRQKLKAWFINEKIPKEERDRMLLVADGNHIMWIPGYRMSRAYKVTEKTKNIVEIQRLRRKRKRWQKRSEMISEEKVDEGSGTRKTDR